MINKFKINLLKIFIEYEELYLAELIGSFKHRTSEGLALSQHQSIRLSIGQIVAKINLMKELISNMALSNQLIEQIRELALSMQKLAGGRAFLSGDIVDFIYSLTIFQKLYFKE